jgi:hypothetical protein
MSEFVIEKGIPAPAPRERVRTGLRRSMELMEVGDSMLVPGKAAGTRAAAHTTAKNIGFRVATMVEGDKTRVWRIA